MLYNQTYLIIEQLEYVLEKCSAYRWVITSGQQQGYSKMTSTLREVFWKMIVS